MNIDSLTAVLSHIEHLVFSFPSKKGSRSYSVDIFETVTQIAQHWGKDAELHLLRCLLTVVDFTVDSRGQPKDSCQAQFLSQLFVGNAVVKSKPGFLSRFCVAFDKPLRPVRLLEKASIAQISRTLKFTPIQEVILGLALAHSKQYETRKAATEFLRKTLPELLHSYSNLDTTKETGLQDCAVEAVHFILTSLCEDPEHFGVTSELKENFIATLRRDFPAEGVPAVLLPWLYTGSEESFDGETEDFAIDFTGTIEMASLSSISGSLALQIEEIGYGFTASFEICKQHLALLTTASSLTPSAVAHVLAMMIRTHTGLETITQFPQLGQMNDVSEIETGWNVSVFAQVLNEIVPDLNWSQVVVELDHPGFAVKDRRGLMLLTRGLEEGLRQNNIFPIALLYKKWENTDGQLSWIIQILLSSDIFCFADHPHRSVQTEVLKAAPEDSNREIATWKSLDLIDTLLHLSDAHGLYHPVQDIFEYPMKHCPDVLALGLLQIPPPMNALRQEILLAIMPVFLGNHPNSAVVLNYAWNSPIHSLQVLRKLIITSMVEWYMKNQDDQSRLTKILDVARDLKDNNSNTSALSPLFNYPNYAFAIDLACLASRRDFLKLDKWLNDKIQESGELFVSACMGILKRRASGAIGITSIGDRGGGAQQLRPEEVATILTCLHPMTTTVSPGLASDIMQCLNSCQQLLSKQTAVGNLSVSSQPSSFSTSSAGGLLTTMMGGSQVPSNPPHPPSHAFGAPPQRNAVDIFASGASGINPLMSRLESHSFGVGGLGVGSGGFGDVLGTSTSASLRNPFGGTVTPTHAGYGQQASVSPAGSMMQSTFPSSIVSVQAPRMPSGGAGWGQAGIVGYRPPTIPSAVSQQGPPGSNLGSIAGAGGNLGVAVPSSSADSWSAAPNTETLIQQSFPEDVQEEANSYFQQIYTQPPQPEAVPDFLENLKLFQKSPNKKQNDVFACMLKNLFEEYKFFPEYPDRELYTTAKVYGGIIREGIISGFPLAVAMRYVMEALKREHGSKMYYFGLSALDEFKPRLKEYPKYSQCIAQLAHFNQFPSTLIEYVKAGIKGLEPVGQKARAETPVWNFEATKTNVSSVTSFSGGGSVQPQSQTPGNAAVMVQRKAGPLTQTNISTLLSASEKDDVEQIVDPPENIQEKVAFMFNNLSQANLIRKVDEMKDFIGSTEEHMPWLARYLVMKRVSIEPNFHHLYNNFLTTFDSTNLNELVREETYRNVKVLLRSDKRQAVANFSDRQLLKSLGHWLGMITLGKNRPILFVDLDLKSLLLEGFYKGQQELLYVVPFITKIMESCKDSKIFAPPNAWTMGILNVLAELHQEPDLKLNLKFEIEVLCNTLKVDLQFLKPGNLLKDTEKLVSAIMKTQQLDDLAVITKQTTLPAGSSPVPPLPVPREPDNSQPGVQPGASMPVPEDEQPVSAAAPSPPPAKFSYHDINVTSFAGLAPHLCINHSLPLFQMNPPLKNLVRPAIEHAVRELITPVAERVIKVAMTTTEHVVKKDFALESDESRMRIAAHHMVRSLTAGMAMITCREPLLLTIQGYLKQAFYSSLRGANNEQQKMIEEAAVSLADDNVELAQCFIVKSACEKALPDIDKRLESEFALRRSAKMENRRYCDPVSLTYQAQRMPEPIRLKVGMVTQQQQEVYKEFSCNISGFKPTTTDDLIVGFGESSGKPNPAAPVATGTGEELERLYQKMLTEIDSLLLSAPSEANSRAVPALRAMRDSLAIAAQQPRDTVSAQSAIQKLVENLLDAYRSQSPEPEWMMRLRDVFVYSVRLLIWIFTAQWVSKMTTKVLIDCRQDYRYNLDAIDILIRVQLVNMVTYDLHLFNSMENGLNFQAVNFAQRLVKLYFVDDQANGVLNQSDLSHTIEMLSRLGSHNRASAEGHMANVLEMLRGDGVVKSSQQGQGSGSQVAGGNFDVMTTLLGGAGGNAPSAPSAAVNATPPRPGAFAERPSGFSAGSQAIGVPGISSLIGGDDDPTDLQQKVEGILREWLSIAYNASTIRDPTTAFSKIVTLMQSNGILRTDDMITRFFRLCTEMCSDLAYRLLTDSGQTPAHVVRMKCFYTLDAFVELISLLVKHSGEGQFAIKINLLTKVLGVVAAVLLQDHEVRRTDFHPLPFHRILIMLFWKLTTPDPLLDPINFQILTAFCNCLHVLQPRKATGFAYAWLDIVGHRAFIGRMLVMTPQHKAWPMYAQLIIDHLKFLVPFLRNIDLPKPVALMYKGTLRVLLVLLHDFPELLCDYHYLLCDVIPPNCVQLRNLVLSAYPRNMRLPDPFMPNLKVDQLPEIGSSPRITLNLGQLIPHELKADLDSYLLNRAPVDFPTDLRSKLQISEEPGQKYNVSLMNAVVLYVGIQAIQAIQAKEQGPSMSTIAHTAYMDIFQSLAVNLDTEGRYLFFNAIANQLRYPNSHTHYFSCTLLYLFLEANLEVIQEQITRILFERLVALRPHPWGLLITFIELIKNPVYKFWQHQFVRCAPEIERLFESVAASCFAKVQQVPADNRTQ